MAESFEEYRDRILGYLGARDPIRVQRATPARLARLLSGVSPRLLRRKPDPTAWSILEVLVHMVDAELAYGWRLRTMLAASGAPLAVWDQDLWVRRLNYHTRRASQALDWFRAFRQSNLALIEAVPRSRLQKSYGVHEVRGRQTVWEFVRQEAGHDLAHQRQIRKLLRYLNSPKGVVSK